MLIALRFLIQWDLERLEMVFHDSLSKNNIKINRGHGEKFSEKTGI